MWFVVNGQDVTPAPGRSYFVRSGDTGSEWPTFEQVINDSPSNLSLQVVDVFNQLGLIDGMEVIVWDENAPPGPAAGGGTIATTPAMNVALNAVLHNSGGIPSNWTEANALGASVLSYPQNAVVATFNNVPFSGGNNYDLLYQNTPLNYVKPGQSYMFSVHVTGSGGGAITVAPPTLTYSAPVGGPNPASQNATLTNPASSSQAWSSSITYGSGGSGWLSLSATSGTIGAGGTQTITVSASVGALAAGSYTATITYTSSDGTSTQNITFAVGGGSGGGLLPGQYLQNGVSNLLFGTQQVADFGNPHTVINTPAIQSQFNAAGYTLMRVPVSNGSTQYSDSEIDARLAACTACGCLPLVIIGHDAGFTFAQHVVSYAGSRCNLFEFFNEPDLNVNIHGWSDYLSYWNSWVPTLRGLNTGAAFGGPALGDVANFSTYLQPWLAGCVSSGILPDFVSFHDYPCGSHPSQSVCATKAVALGSDATTLRGILVSTLGSTLGNAMPIGITEWNIDWHNPPISYANQANGGNASFISTWYTSAIDGMVSAGVALACQFDASGGAEGGEADLISTNSPFSPQDGFSAFNAEIARYLGGPLSGAGISPGISISNIKSIVKFDWYDIDGNLLAGGPSNYSVPPSGTVQISVSATAPTTAAYAQIAFGAETTVSGNNSGVVTFTYPQFEPMYFVAQGVSYPTSDCNSNQANCALMPDGTVSRACRMFSGYIDDLQWTWEGGHRLWTLSVASAGMLLDNGPQINESVSNIYDDQIIGGIITNYFSGLLSISPANQFAANPIVRGILVPSDSYSDKTFRDLLNGLSGQSGYNFFVDPYYRLHYNPQFYAAAQFGFSDQADNIYTFPMHDFSGESDGTSRKRNIKILGGNYLAPYVDSYTATSGQTIFTLTWQPKTPTGKVVVNGSGVTTGVYGVHDPTKYVVLVDKAGLRLVFTSGVANGTSVSYSYSYEAPVSCQVIDQDTTNPIPSPSYAQPPYFSQVHDTSITSLAGGTLRGLAELTAWSKSKLLYYFTANQYVQPGLIVYLTSHSDNVINQPFVVTKVDASFLGNGINEYAYTVGAYLPSITDHIRYAYKAHQLSSTTANVTVPQNIDIVFNEFVAYSENPTTYTPQPGPPYLYGFCRYGFSAYG